MGLIVYAINKIKAIGIPKEILELAFLNIPNRYGIAASIDSQIENLVIDSIVLPDLNVLGGLKVSIEVDRCETELVNVTRSVNNAVIRVPFELTNGRKIIEPLNLMILYQSEFTYGGNERLLQTLDQLERSKLSMENNMRPIADLRLIAPNTILVYEPVMNLTNSILNVMVEHNRDLSNLSMRHADNFYELVKRACKAYIYNTVRIELDRGAIYNGHELGKVNEIIESYATAEEEYQQFLNEKWGKIMFMADEESKSDYIKGMIGLF